MCCILYIEAIFQAKVDIIYCRDPFESIYWHCYDKLFLHVVGSSHCKSPLYPYDLTINDLFREAPPKSLHVRFVNYCNWSRLSLSIIAGMMIRNLMFIYLKTCNSSINQPWTCALIVNCGRSHLNPSIGNDLSPSLLLAILPPSQLQSWQDQILVSDLNNYTCWNQDW